jgi:hypothetical protein
MKKRQKGDVGMSKEMRSKTAAQAPAPCESCPPHCSQCAWDHQRDSSKPITPKNGSLVTVRTAAEYGCVNKRAAIVVDSATHEPFMQIGGKLHPLSAAFGSIIAGTRLERDIVAA